MAKLIHILAASVGGGLILGASIRLGEVLGSTAMKAETRRLKPASRKAPTSGLDGLLADRLGRLENRVRNEAPLRPETRSTEAWQSVVADVVARMDRQQTEVETMRHQMENAARAMDTIGDIAENLRDDLHRQLSEDLDQRLSALEEKLHLSMKTAQRETVSDMVASIETRIAPRIGRLETEIGDQAATVAALRECSVQSERSILRLLTVLERTVHPTSRPADPDPGQRPSAGQAGTPEPTRPDSFRGDLPKLSVMMSRGQDEPDGGGGAVRRPA